MKHAPKAAWVGLVSAAVAIAIGVLGWVYGYGRLTAQFEAHAGLPAHGSVIAQTNQVEKKVEVIDTKVEAVEEKVDKTASRQETIITTIEAVKEDVHSIKVENAAQTEQLKGVNKTLERIERKLDVP